MDVDQCVVGEVDAEGDAEGDVVDAVSDGIKKFLRLSYFEHGRQFALSVQLAVERSRCKT